MKSGGAATDSLVRWAALRGDAVAFVSEHSSLSYAELDASANGVALRLADSGASDTVGIPIERSLDFVVAVIGVLKAGAAFVPLAHGLPESRLSHMLDDAGIDTVIGVRPPLDGPLASRRFISLQQCPPVPGAGAAQARVDGETAACVFYTSGSTGLPKGVVIPHAALQSRLASPPLRDELGPEDVYLFKSSVGFSSVLREIFWPLHYGASSVIVPPGHERDPGKLLALMRRHAVTVCHLVPSQLRSILQLPGLADCTALRHVVVGGEPLPPDVPHRFHAVSGAQLHQIYGSTEATTATSHTFERDASLPSTVIGTRANLPTFLLDADLRPVAPGEIGEICVGGPGLASGYLNAAELTARKFVRSALNVEGDGMLYRTGDYGSLRPDGLLQFAGRSDEQVKIRGHRIELNEVRSAVGSLEFVQDVEVVVSGAEPATSLVIYFIPVDGVQAPPFDEITRRLGERLPEYMLPSRCIPVPLFPMNDIGKLDVAALAEAGAERPWLDAQYAEPRDALEATIARIWAERLGLERVGVHDDFFHLGGHSLLVLETMQCITEHTGKRLDVGEMFDNPTIAQIARLLDNRDGEHRP